MGYKIKKEISYTISYVKIKKLKHKTSIDLKFKDVAVGEEAVTYFGNGYGIKVKRSRNDEEANKPAYFVSVTRFPSLGVDEIDADEPEITVHSLRALSGVMTQVQCRRSIKASSGGLSEKPEGEGS